MIDVCTFYDRGGAVDPALDRQIWEAVGRPPDFGGCGDGGEWGTARDLGWTCTDDVEADRIADILRGLGMPVQMEQWEDNPDD
jgi:hypothetical protein